MSTFGDQWQQPHDSFNSMGVASGSASRFPGGNPNGPIQAQHPIATGPSQPPTGQIGQPVVPGQTYGVAQSTVPATPSGNPLQPNPGEIAALAPANIQQFGGTPMVNPTYANAAQQQALFGTAATVDPNQNLGYMQQYERLLAQGLAPQFQQQNQTLADQLAARGLTNSGTGQQLTNDLYGQQAAALANATQPIVSQAYGYTQQDILGNQGAQNQYGLANLGYGNQALGTNAAYAQQANLANAGASNEADVINAQYYNQDRNANYGAYNNFENQMLGLGSGNFNALQAAYLNSFGPNTGVESAYGNALSGQQSVYGNVFGNAINSGNNMLGSAFGALGQH